VKKALKEGAARGLSTGWTKAQKKLGVVVHVFNLSTGEAEAGGGPGLHSETKTNK
jgi:hypothetical protein